MDSLRQAVKFVIRDKKTGSYVGSRRYSYRNGTYRNCADFKHARVFNTRAAAVLSLKALDNKTKYDLIPIYVELF